MPVRSFNVCVRVCVCVSRTYVEATQHVDYIWINVVRK